MKNLSSVRPRLLLWFALCLVLLAGCSGKNQVVGIYDLKTIVREGTALEVDQLPQGEDGSSFSVTLDLREDGTFSLDLSALGDASSMSGVWEEQGGQVLLTSGFNTLSAAWSDGVLTLEQEKQTLTFQLRAE